MIRNTSGILGSTKEAYTPRTEGSNVCAVGNTKYSNIRIQPESATEKEVAEPVMGAKHPRRAVWHRIVDGV